MPQGLVLFDVVRGHKMVDEAPKGRKHAHGRMLSPAEERRTMESIANALRRPCSSGPPAELLSLSRAAKRARSVGDEKAAAQLMGILYTVRDLRIGKNSMRDTLQEIEGLWPKKAPGP